MELLTLSPELRIPCLKSHVNSQAINLEIDKQVQIIGSSLESLESNKLWDKPMSKFQYQFTDIQ